MVQGKHEYLKYKSPNSAVGAYGRTSLQSRVESRGGQPSALTGISIFGFRTYGLIR